MPANGIFTLTDSGKLAIRDSGKADVCDDCCDGEVSGLFGVQLGHGGGLYKFNLTDGSRSLHILLAIDEFDIDAQGNEYTAAPSIIFKFDSGGSTVWSKVPTTTFTNIRDVAVDESGRVCVVGSAGTSDNNIEFYEADGTYIAGYQTSTDVTSGIGIGNHAWCARARGDGHFLVGCALTDTWDDSPGTGDSNKRDVLEFLASDGSNTDSFVTCDPSTELSIGVSNIAITDDGGFGCSTSHNASSSEATYVAVKFDSAGSYDYQVATTSLVSVSVDVMPVGNDCIYLLKRGVRNTRDQLKSFDDTGGVNWTTSLPSAWDNLTEAIGVFDGLLLASTIFGGEIPRVYNTSGVYQRDMDDNENYYRIKPVTVGSTP